MAALPELNLRPVFKAKRAPNLILEGKYGRYEMQKKVLGQGAYGKVYLGLVFGTDQQVAIKHINAEDVDQQRAAQEEIAVLAYISQFHISHILGLIDGPIQAPRGGWYIVLPLVNGEDLDRYLFDLRYEVLTPPSQMQVSQGLLTMMIQMAEAMHRLGEICMVHHDIKPPNIMKVKGEYNSMVVDFGIGCAISGCKSQQLIPRTVPRCPLMRATEGFTPPEYFQGEKGDLKKFDVYAFGKVFHDMATGDFTLWKTSHEIDAFMQKNPQQILKSMKTGSDQLNQILAGMLHPDFNQRLTFAQATQRLQQIRLNQPLTITTTGAAGKAEEAGEAAPGDGMDKDVPPSPWVNPRLGKRKNEVDHFDGGEKMQKTFGVQAVDMVRNAARTLCGWGQYPPC